MAHQHPGIFVACNRSHCYWV